MKGYIVILSPDPNAGGYSVVIPAMRGAITEGDTREEALANAAEVMALWLEGAAEDGYAPADETPQLVTEVVGRVLEGRAEEGWDLQVEFARTTPATPVAA